MQQIQKRGGSPKTRDRLLDSRQRGLPTQHLERLKQGRSIFSPANGYANRLKHLARFDSELLGSRAQALIQRIVFEFDVC